jgi:hypothetical protein
MLPAAQSITGLALFVVGLAFVDADRVLRAQTPAAPTADAAEAAPLNWTTQQDHQNMMEQLGIQALRPGPNGRPGAPNSLLIYS